MSASAGRRLYFAMPSGLERFLRFKDLPYDIRHKIWEDVIFTPGIHFLKFERNEARTISFDDESDDEDLFDDDEDDLPEPQNPRRPESGKALGTESKKRFTATLKPIFPLPAADMSYYMTKSKALAQLSLSCNEAAYEVDRVTSKPDNLTLDSGRLIALANSSDIICIDYPDLLHTRGLSSWANTLDLSQLSRIRRVAVRYQPSWDEERRFCRICGRYHEILPGSRKEQAPRRHLYEFAALFPNLETFYFVDHLIVRRPSGLSEDEHADPRWLGPSDRARVMAELSVSSKEGKKAERFESGSDGRTYFEIDRELCTVCKVHSHVFNMLEWVQENYVAHCEKDTNKHRGPRGVRFAVLACEWGQEQLVAEKIKKKPPPLSTTKSRKSQKRRHKRITNDDPELLEAMMALRLESSYRDFALPAGLPVVFGDEGVSTFEFTFRV
ncbi:hypothetical protein AB5N19_02491 [Seiridium cardinale]|uniref:Uncharacterized protein n=1 Tax=Seiridium cardinale TaxID=138064 RepID=A0ABR2XIC0_9PEZI